ncbi:hypothetical protein [Mycobacterium sp. 852002-10029_SCH5224772]|uniref:hypothetical protein n=1 Tax=Mycobacterium sp. 852002-10029_SCH5224772 TaxID=1834083 RepID=UPI000801591B|nr:hypothetical protein [Mycobacterium sp. 852002-10029_SCH5224772]OBE98988.1 hypothetical protein A5775_07545 [Mycobacterium sp. 852002-10029_SCH5224772]
MIINPLLTDVTHARRLIAAVTDCGVQPPESLTSVLEGLDALTELSAPADPTQALIRGALDGGPAKAEKMLADYAVAKLAAEERKNLRGRLDPEFLKEFCDRLEAGGADAILDALRPQFDTAAKAIADAAAKVDVTAPAAALMDTADPDQLVAWQSVIPAIDTLDQIASVASQFGPQAQSFVLVDRPHGIEFGWARNEAVMCSAGSLLQDSRAFATAGTDVRKSAWLRVAPRLNTIAEARERVREYSEQAWSSMNGQAKRGRVLENGSVVWDETRNPFATAER